MWNLFKTDSLLSFLKLFLLSGIGEKEMQVYLPFLKPIYFTVQNIAESYSQALTQTQP